MTPCQQLGLFVEFLGGSAHLVITKYSPLLVLQLLFILISPCLVEDYLTPCSPELMRELSDFLRGRLFDLLAFSLPTCCRSRRPQAPPLTT